MGFPPANLKEDAVIKRTQWVARRFSFDLSVSMFPNILERLRGTPPRLEDRVQNLPSPMLTRRAGHAWSIQENAGHLIEVEALWLGRLDDFAAGAEVLRPADMENRRTDAADYNEKPLADILAAFRSVRSGFVQRLEALDREAIETPILHPRLNQPMRILDMMVFAAEHDDHHLAGITALMRAFSSGQ
jgi:uncharacterized damage-inducible protein DinB